MTDEGFPFVLPPEEEPTTPTVDFQAEAIDFELEHQAQITHWIETVISRENCRLHLLNFVFCTDEYLHQINLEYLQHDTFTDIITFPYASPPLIHGDIFISLDRIRENADTLRISFAKELHRVMIHGVLHLCGYGDKSPEEKKQMTRKEDESLRLLSRATSE